MAGTKILEGNNKITKKPKIGRIYIKGLLSKIFGKKFRTKKYRAYNRMANIDKEKRYHIFSPNP